MNTDRITDDELTTLEAEVQRAFTTGDQSGLRLLGYGEISLVLGSPAGQPRMACKRLPAFPTIGQAEAFAHTVDDYIARLRQRGVDVLDTDVRCIDGGDGAAIVYCVQPLLAGDSLAVNVVRADPGRAAEVFTRIVEHIFDTADSEVGLDAQLANWAVGEKGLIYYDITTPILRHADGSEALDTAVFMASFPWLLRRPIGRFVVPDILERYHQPRSIALDLAANLVKERLDQHIGIVLAALNPRVGEPLTEAEIRADYRSDARMWNVLQALRRADRAWQRRVRRRPYAFLLPEHIER